MKTPGFYLHGLPSVLSKGKGALSLESSCVNSREENEKGPYPEESQAGAQWFELWVWDQKGWALVLNSANSCVGSPEEATLISQNLSFPCSNDNTRCLILRADSGQALCYKVSVIISLVLQRRN